MKYKVFAGIAVLLLGVTGLTFGVIQSPTAEAKLSKQSPNPIDVSAGGASGGVSHLLKKETVADVTELKTTVYYPNGSDDGKTLQIRYGIDGKKCKILDLNDHFANENAFVYVRINVPGGENYEYRTPLKRVCDDQQDNSGNTQNNKRVGENNEQFNKFFANYDLPALAEDPATGLFIANVNIGYSGAVVEGASQQNSVNFVMNLTGADGKAKVGLRGEVDDNQFGLRSAYYTNSQRRDVQAATQFGVPCDRNPNAMTVKLFDPDVSVFGTTLLWVTEDGKRLPNSRYNLSQSAYVSDANNDGVFGISDNVPSNQSASLRILDPKKNVTYRFYIHNKVTNGKASPNGNVLSVGLPFDSIYGDINCDPDTGGDPFTPNARVRELIEPEEEYTFVGRISGGEVEKKPNESNYRPVEYRFHKIQYRPGVNPYGTGTFIETRSVNDIDCSYFLPSPNPNASCVVQEPAGNDTMEELGGGQVNNLRAVAPNEKFPNDSEPGSTICYAVSVKRPSEVYSHNWTYYHDHGGYEDPDTKIYYPDYDTHTDPSGPHYYYRDEDHIHPDNGSNPYSGGVSHTAVNRQWATSISCVMVGKRPKVQIVGNDLRVRSNLYSQDEQIGGDVIANVTEHQDELKYGSWVEYGAFVFGADKDVGSGAGLRGGSIYDVNQRDNWSKLTFANDPEYGGYVKGFQNQPGVSDYVDAATSTGAVTLAGSVPANAIASNPSDIYRASTPGTTIELGEQTGITGSKLIYVNGDVTITGNITLADATYTDPADIPQVIIVANNIDIRDNVSRIDAWLITYQIEDDGDDATTNGNIDTCSNGPPIDQRNSNQCNNLLEVFGPVLSQTLELNRTGPVVFGPDAPAERFNGRLEGYFWAFERQQTKDTAQTVNIVEAPVRF